MKDVPDVTQRDPGRNREEDEELAKIEAGEREAKRLKDIGREEGKRVALVIEALLFGGIQRGIKEVGRQYIVDKIEEILNLPSPWLCLDPGNLVIYESLCRIRNIKSGYIERR